jgi:hypothetical protein
MKEKLFYGVSILIAVGLGYHLGIRCCPQSGIANQDIHSPLETKSKDQIIPLKQARILHETLKNYLKRTSSVDSLKHFLSHPIDIDSAQIDFEAIFKQEPKLGLRMYPAMRYEKGKPQITFIFIATKNGSDLIYEPGDTFKGKVVTEQSAMIQDNNRPCNPCIKTTFTNYTEMP